MTAPEAGPAGPAATGDAGLGAAGDIGPAATGDAGLRAAGDIGPAATGDAGLRAAGEAGLAVAAAEIDALLAAADRDLAAAYPGEVSARQPVHTVYVPADRYLPGLPASWGRQALSALDNHVPGPVDFAVAMGLPPGVAADVLPLVRAKLAAEPVEDLRLDFEDGYGERGDETEDADAASAAAVLAAAVAAGTAPSFIGLRCKSLQPATRHRAIRTLDIFLAGLLSGGPLPAGPLPAGSPPAGSPPAGPLPAGPLPAGSPPAGSPPAGPLPAGSPPAGFVLTLPKVTSAAQVAAMAQLCGRLEQAHGLAHGRLAFEIQVETPQVILGADGTAVIARCVHAAAGRLTGLHYGTYDYSAALGIAASYQSMAHPAADYARAVMQVAAAGTGVRLSDGSSNVLPEGSREDVTAAWELHSRLVRRSLERGFYQGWDLHPAQLASRFAATFAFFREDMPAACARLRSITERATGGLLEEPATARALAGYLTRGLDCGAITPAEVAARSGLDCSALEALR